MKKPLFLLVGIFGLLCGCSNEELSSLLSLSSQSSSGQSSVTSSSGASSNSLGNSSSGSSSSSASSSSSSSSSSSVSSSSSSSSSMVTNNLTDSLLSLFRGDKTFRGKVKKVEASSSMEIKNAKITFNSDRVKFDDVDAQQELLLYKGQGSNDPEKVYLYNRTRKNQVLSTEIEEWKNVKNPFDSFVVDDFTKVAEGSYALNSDKKEMVLKNFGYFFFNDGEIEIDVNLLDSFVLNLQNGQIKSFKIATTSQQEDENESYVLENEWVLEETAEVLPALPEVFSETSNHAKLISAFDALKTQSYKMKYKIERGSSTQEFSYTYGSDGTYFGFGATGEEGYGFAHYDDEYFGFQKTSDQILKGKVATAEDLTKYSPSFNNLGPEEQFSFALFEDKGDGVFEAYNDKIEGESIAQVLAQYFVTKDHTLINTYAEKATSLKITLSAADAVQEVSFDFNNSGSLGKVTIAFVDIGTASLGFDFSSIPELEEGGSGSWSSGEQEDFNGGGE